MWGIQAAIKAGASSIILESDLKGVIRANKQQAEHLNRIFLGDSRHSRS